MSTCCFSWAKSTFIMWSIIQIWVKVCVDRHKASVLYCRWLSTRLMNIVKVSSLGIKDVCSIWIIIAQEFWFKLLILTQMMQLWGKNFSLFFLCLILLLWRKFISILRIAFLKLKYISTIWAIFILFPKRMRTHRCREIPGITWLQPRLETNKSLLFFFGHLL